jgi:dienelactone hydrolase
MFEFVPGNYKWSRTALFVANITNQISEVHEIMDPLNNIPAGANQGEAWFENWSRMAERLRRLAEEDEARGWKLSASRKYLRSALYFISAEFFVDRGHPRRRQVYEDAMRMFAKGVEYSGRPTEFVEVPFEDTTFPALFIPAFQADGSPSPCMIHFDGSEDVKEFTYCAVNHGMADRGVSLLIVDHPGSGGGLRLRGLPVRHDIEVPAAACVDYLEGREDVDSDRIGIIAESLGGFYSVRSAAFEKRFKCCVAWGALWDWAATIEERKSWFPTPHDFLANLFMTDDEAELRRQVSLITLEGVADKVECPLLVVHGVNDRQVGVWAAEKTVEAAVDSPRRELKIFGFDEGGVEHCMIDNPTIGTDYMYSWIAEVLEADPAPPYPTRGQDVASSSAA